MARNPQTATKLTDLKKTASNVHAIKADLDDVRSLKVRNSDIQVLYTVQ